ncbi:glutamine synthetase family protein [Actinocorallia sp. A-T 12471]|uniref:glutamine synthetase family protein n=1 Tax=Actinocorallia sp. A-T 12471 TaxID=3089813 RepID=UPI0029CC7517|nr:glutamine synthetase family protein [Actinocorallia sp. A-T 12471]MDX6744894.1 glutamine synthetase family protein [Actinocorallia sp. A-T 12471]
MAQDITADKTREKAAVLARQGVVGLTVAWADNNGITRSRTVPIEQLEAAAERGVGVTTLFAVFDTHDGITFGHAGLSTPSGDVRLVPVVDRIVRLAGQPEFAWAPGRQIAADGSPWPYDQRSALERQVARAAERGLAFRAGYELEFHLSLAEPRGDGGTALALEGPAYGPRALLEVDGFAARLLRDLRDNGVEIGQLHAEYGPAQFELSLAAADPVTAADRQLLARQTIHAAARAHGLRASFSPLVSAAGVGNGWHLHTSVSRDGVNLLSGGDGPHGLTPEGAAYLAGILRDLPAVTAITAPSIPSLHRLRPGYFSSAYAFWGVENREAALRFVPATGLLGAAHANVELKPSDASANPYLALAAVIAAGLAGIADGLTPPAPVQENPGAWTEEEREKEGIRLLPTTPEERQAALVGSETLREALGADLLGAFAAVREADRAWAEGKELDEVLAAHLWRY